MKIKGVFIGINEYLSLDVPNLVGASRDAQALWALFSDTFLDIDAKLLNDNSATAEEIKKNISETLQKADVDDVVIISFSGHGTRSHRLVAHDTTKEQLDSTTIPMDFLADQFRRSKAKIVICVLDCCFSGGAPAKVFEDTPTPREIDNPYEKLQGKGRILLAASSAVQPAYERPGIGHGLLTEAFIRVLKNGTGEINLAEAVFQIADIVKAEAIRMGVTQTPVIASLIEGGLVFPVLQEGAKYSAFFPPERSVVVSNELSDLLHLGLPEVVINEWKGKYGNGLNSLQLKAINQYKVLAGESLLVVAPTSSGKTFIGEMAAVKAISAGKKAVFLLPYRALVNEKYQEFSELYGTNIGMKVIRCSGDYSDQTVNFIRGKYDLAIFTFEMFLNLVVSNPSVLNQIGLVVLDEAQFVTDSFRGASIELLLTCILAARERGVAPQLLALSAVIGNVNNFDAWLRLNLLLTEERPVPLIEGVVDRSGIYQFRAPDGSVQQEQLIPVGLVYQRGGTPSTQDLIVPLVRQLVSKDEKVLIFRNQKGSAQGCANYLANELGLSPANDFIDLLPTLDQSTSSQVLKKCLSGGTAFHTANLSRDEREVVEKAFRDSKSSVRVLAATTTVAAGVNTPASTVIIAEHKFLGADGREFTVSEYKNMAGRAGRMGYTEAGKSIIYAESSMQRNQLFQKYVLGKVESMKSSFTPDSSSTWVVRLLAQVKWVPEKDIVKLLANTYGGYLESLSDSGWVGKMEVQVPILMSRMFQLGILEKENDLVQLTPLGRACGNSSLSFESALRLVESMRHFSSWKLDKNKLIILVQLLEESDSVYTPLSRRGEPIRVQQAMARFGNLEVSALQRFAGDTNTYHARCKRVAILYDWINGVSLEKIEKDFSFSPFQGSIQAGSVRGFADNARFHLRSAFQIASVVAAENLCTEKEFDNLLKQVEVGLPEEGVELLKLQLALNRGEYLLLLSRGVKNQKDLWGKPAEELIAFLGPARAKQLEKIRPK